MEFLKRTDFPSQIKQNGKVYLPSNRFVVDSRVLIISPDDYQKVVIVQNPSGKLKVYEESFFSVQDEKDLKFEIQHIFESGANEIRIFDMIRLFVNQRAKSSSKN